MAAPIAAAPWASAEERRKAEEAKAKRRRDLLALRIQEKEFVPVPQVPYERKDVDTVKREGKEKERVVVVEDGRVQESLLGVAVCRKDGGRETKLGDLAVNA
ncbi:MAG: hypothetical protein MUE73_17110, partial [Planctomycetes bacterium]|nr:hypothetical protein [Planctomycetota bacterium]